MRTASKLFMKSASMAVELPNDRIGLPYEVNFK
jgi:hypothetical protein